MIEQMQSSTLTYNNGEIYYEVVGAGEPIVFIHGFTLDHRMWQPQVDLLSEKYQVITYDARGFGRSSLPDGAYSHDEDLYALLEHLGIAKAHLVGLSMGGRIATNFTLTHPSMVQSLTLMDSALDGYASTVDWNVHAKELGIQAAKENWLKHEVFAETRNHPEVVAALRVIVEEYSGWHWLHKDTQSPASSGALARLAEIVVPTLIMVGEKDLPYFHDIADVMATGIPDAQKIIVEGAGHMVNMEAPAGVTSILEDFISKRY